MKRFFLILILFINSFNFILTKHILIFNLITNTPSPSSSSSSSSSSSLSSSKEIDLVLNHLLKFLNDSKNFNFSCDNNNLICLLYCNQNILEVIKNNNNNNNLKELLNNDKIYSYSLNSVIDKSVGYKTPRIEHVSEILSSMKDVSELYHSNDDRIVSLSFSSTSYPVFTTLTPKMFEFIDSKKDSKNIFLFDKTRELTSVSDWHDLMTVWFAPSVAKKWIDTTLSIYRKHADRPVYTLLEPRAAIIEATIRTKDEVNVGSFRRHDMCIESTEASNQLHEQEHGSICFENSKVILRINCGEDATSFSAHACTTLYRPESWKREMKHLTHDITHKVLHDMNQITKEFPKMEKLAPIRFRNAYNYSKPLDFCWNTGNDTESHHKFKIFSSSFKDYKPYVKPASREDYKLPKYKIIIMSGSDGHPNPLDGILYPSLSKIYYAHRHGYTFKHALSSQYVKYFGPGFLENTPLGVNSYGQAVMSKVPMIFGMMLDNPDHDWILWTDDDTYINSGWLDLPLEAFLHDVPDNKLVVLANYRSAFTNAFFIRNTPEGRELAMDWLAVAESGYIQCHGFDQAALETLILIRTHDGREMKTLTPFNHTCINSKWFDDKNAAKRAPEEFLRDLPKSPPEWDWGCDGGASWSCDFRYENSFTRLGFHSRSAGFHKPVSSFSKGCANDYVPDFHVISEDETRPRLHCSYCVDEDYIYSIQFGYDGPLGSGNDWVRRDAVNSWFLNHKTWYPFYETYTKPDACKKNTEFVPKCDEEAVNSLLDGKKTHAKRMIVSLTDGYAFDVKDKTYCYGSKELYDYQMKTTYMQSYPKLILIAKTFPKDEWNKIYHEHYPTIGPKHPFPNENSYFEEKDFCSKCKKVHQPEYPLGDHMVLDCRH